MANLKGTKTAENLMKSFAGESQARMRYAPNKCPACDHSKDHFEVFKETY